MDKDKNPICHCPKYDRILEHSLQMQICYPPLGQPLHTTKTKTKQRMTHWTTQQDLSDWIFCFVGHLGWWNITLCFVWRNTKFTKPKRVPFGETFSTKGFDWMRTSHLPYIIVEWSYKTVITVIFGVCHRNLFLLSHTYGVIWLDESHPPT